MRVSLIAGLILRHGQQTIELVRQLNDDEYQFENCLTKRPMLIKRSELLKRIWDKTYEIVLSDSPSEGTPLTDSRDKGRIDLGSIGLEARSDIERRLTYIGALQKAHVTRGQRKRVGPLVKKVSVRIGAKKPRSASTVMGWAREYQKSQLNPLALLNGNTDRRRQTRTHPVMEELVSRMIQTVYLTRSRHSQRHTLDRIVTEAKKLVEQRKIKAEQAVFSSASLSRRIREVDLFRRIAAREGPARARMVCRTVMEGAGAAYPLQRVEVDHTPLNWIAVCDRTGLPLGRPLLTVVIDSYSNYVLGIYLSFYGAGVSSVSGVVRNALMPKDDFVAGVTLEHRWLAAGVPDEFILDNGLEFHAIAFTSMAWGLGSDMTYCRVRTPWLKPHVERFFRSLDYLSLERGRIHKRVANVMNLDPRKDAAIKFTDLVKGLIMFVTDVQPFTINQRKLARPYDLMMEGLEYCPPASFPLDMDSLRLATAMSKELTLGPGGIELRGLPFGREELLPLHKRYGERFKTLVKWDPDDLGHIWIQDPREKSWIESPCRWPEYAIGRSWNQHLVTRNFAIKELKRQGAYEDLMQANLRLHDHWMNATSHRTSADAKLAAKYCGVTSARVMAASESKQTPLSPEKIIADVETAAQQEREIPSFDAFEIM